MLRCRCGVWTDYGMTCVSCRSEAYKNVSPTTSKDAEGSDNVIDVIDDVEELEDEAEEDS